jgi:hypothetical protein
MGRAGDGSVATVNNGLRDSGNPWQDRDMVLDNSVKTRVLQQNRLQ